MPYVYYEELPENVEEVSVVEESVFNDLKSEYEKVVQQRDEAIERAEKAEEGWSKTKQKYADAFLTTPSKVKEKSGKVPEISKQTISSLFS